MKQFLAEYPCSCGPRSSGIDATGHCDIEVTGITSVTDELLSVPFRLRVCTKAVNVFHDTQLALADSIVGRMMTGSTWAMSTK